MTSFEIELLSPSSQVLGWWYNGVDSETEVQERSQRRGSTTRRFCQG